QAPATRIARRGALATEAGDAARTLGPARARAGGRLLGVRAAPAGPAEGQTGARTGAAASGPARRHAGGQRHAGSELNGVGGRGGNRQHDGEQGVREDDVLQPVAGILDVLDNDAFVRTSGYLAGANDVYVSMTRIRRHGLRGGDAITGAVRMPRDGQDGGGGG